MPVEQFQRGDVVQLKSGGQKMTIKDFDGNEVVCVWFDGSSQKEGYFSPITLAKVMTGTTSTPL